MRGIQTACCSDVMAENAQVRPSSGTAPPAKKARVEEAEESEDEVDRLRRYLSDLENTQDSLNELNEKASEEILRVEQRFNELRKPHFSRRSEIITEIPQFWMQALLSHPLIGPIITEEDEEPLTHLIDVNVEEFQDIKSGYKIEFRFSENEHFTNEVLTKTYNLSSSNERPSTTEHTPIDWRPNMSLVDQFGARKGRDSTSFFSWFVEKTDSSGLGELIKDELWSDPVQYYMTAMVEEANGPGSENGEDEDDDDVDGVEDNVGPAGFVFQNEDGTFVDEDGNPVEPYEDDDEEAEYISSPEEAGQQQYEYQQFQTTNPDPVYISDGEEEEGEDEDEEGFEDDQSYDSEGAEVLDGVQPQAGDEEEVNGEVVQIEDVEGDDEEDDEDFDDDDEGNEEADDDLVAADQPEDAE
ncbi:protein SET-like [Sycon ciliatum]|uniref:protein SET-like n=1 Tax=Sycon ciliatum TaxID=27933 RepID=UPI0031F6DFD8